MSLDVYLHEPNPEYSVWQERKSNSVAEAGEMQGITPLVEQYYQDRKPEQFNEVYWANITHNLGKMADAAGIYQHLWRPEELGIILAKDLIEPLTEGLKKMKADPDHYKQFNASNGWGLYEHFIPWIEKYLEACKQYPEAEISVSR